MSGKWFALAVLAIPFSDFYGSALLGEMRFELSAYLFLPIFIAVVIERLFANRTAGQSTASPDTMILLPSFVLALLSVIVFSGIMNLPDLLGPSVRGRLPADKFIFSTIVVMYGFALAYISYHFVERNSWHRMIVKPVCISIVLAAIMAVLEILSDHGGVWERLYAAVATVVHSGVPFRNPPLATVSDAIEGRVKSLCFEPPALAAFAGFAWPWAYAGVATADRRYKCYYIVVLLLCTGLSWVAMSRTSGVMVFANVIAYLLLRLVYLPPQPRNPRIPQVASVVLVTLGVAGVAYGLLNLDGFTEAVKSSNYVSNVSRFALITAAVKMFLARPFWGYGFGQFGFHYVDFLPAWGYSSWEIRAWVDGINGWPSVFSIYARFAGEAGLVAVLVWVGIWLTLMRAIWRVTLAYQAATGKLLILSYPLIMSCVCSLVSGVAVDSVRPPLMWISMGIGCCYVRDVRRRLVSARRAASEPIRMSFSNVDGRVPFPIATAFEPGAKISPGQQ